MQILLVYVALHGEMDLMGVIDFPSGANLILVSQLKFNFSQVVGFFISQ